MLLKRCIYLRSLTFSVKFLMRSVLQRNNKNTRNTGEFTNTTKMFLSALKDHQREQEELKTEINNKRVIAEKAVEKLTADSVKQLNDGVAQAYLNQHKIDTESRKLQNNVANLTKQAQQWMIVCKNLNEAVKDLGDITTWTKTIQNDVQFIAEAIGESYKPKTDDN